MRKICQVANHLHFRMSGDGEVVIHNDSANTVNRCDKGFPHEGGIIAGRPNAPDTRALLRLVHERYIPNKFLLLADGGAGQRQIATWLRFVDSIRPKDGKATAYICENYVCKLPTNDPTVVARLLDEK